MGSEGQFAFLWRVLDFFVVIPLKAVGKQIASAETCSDLEEKLVVYKMFVSCKIIES